MMHVNTELIELASSPNHFGLTSSAILWAMSLILPAVARDMVPNSNKSANGKDEKKISKRENVASCEVTEVRDYDLSN